MTEPRDAPPILVLTGTTASGKSEVALETAERIGGEILSLDSMLVYRGMDIGTAKPGGEDRARVPHHMIDLVLPHETMNLSVFVRHAEDALSGIRSRGKVPVAVGGTALSFAGAR